MKKFVSIALALLLVVMLFAACGGNGGEEASKAPAASAGESSTAPEESKATEGGGNGKADSDIRVDVILQTYTGSFWSDVMRGIEKAEAELKEKGVTVEFNGPEDSSNYELQIQLIETAITNDTDCIAIAPAEAQVVGNAVDQKCVPANVPVVLFDCSSTSTNTVSLVASDNYKLGTFAGNALAEGMGQQGKYIVSGWSEAVRTNGMRSWGAIDVIKAKYPTMECYKSFFTEGVTDADVTFVKDTLSANKDIKGVIATSESQTVNATSVIKELGKTDTVTFVGIDITPVSLDWLENGMAYAMVTQNPFNMGYLGTMTAYQVAKGEEVPADIDSGSAVVKKDNQDDPEVKAILEELKLV